MACAARDSSRVSPFTGTGGVLMGPRGGGVDLGVPVDVAVEFGQGDDVGLNRAHVPSAAHRENRPCAVFHGP